MNLKELVLRTENLKAVKELHEAGIDHRVIALFLSSEGIPMKPEDVHALIQHYEMLAMVKLPSKKVQALIHAKQVSMEDESMPCPV